MQGTRVRSLVQEDPTCRRATKPMCHKRACTPEPVSLRLRAREPQLLKPVCLEPVLRNKRSHCSEKPVHRNKDSSLEQEKKTEKSLTPVQTREQEGKSTPDGEDNEEIEEEMDDGPLLVPRVKVAEDGSIILDEESLSKSFTFTETDMFFLAISMVGTDFSMIGQLFPHRARIEIKVK
ncbi:hypothetical protein J1605_010692 [Eschrichtius robustus]|uniref:Transcription factor TFIIIB component B'' Myb domain-containing protein n=1 Tax=Eschrichtius robustus TaxID=9764 RepID=A0AB34GR73_ESCRO|nr:hypothetical protein J1605_010692 [Eschrichtius robustus]